MDFHADQSNLGHRMSDRFRWLARRHRRHLRGPAVALRYRGLRSSDVLLAGYPRSGTTWLTFVLAEVLSGVPSTWASTGNLIPAVGRHRSAPALLPSDGRLLRTHERRRPGGGGAVYVVRDPADVAASYYKWFRFHRLDPGPFARFFDLYLEGRIDGYGPWSAHVESWLESGAACHVVRFEDLLRNPCAEVTGALRFLGVVHVDPGAIHQAVDANARPRMREKEALEPAAFGRHDPAGRFVGAGRAGLGWSWLTPSQRAALSARTGRALRLAGYRSMSGPS